VGEPSTSARREFALPRVWRDYLAFLRSPVLPARTKPFGPAAVRDVGALLVLDAIMGAMLVGLAFLAEEAGYQLPDPDLGDDFMLFLVLAIFVAPPLEELVFRGWLTGRPSHLLLLSIPLLILVLLLLPTLGVPAYVTLIVGWAGITIWSAFALRGTHSVPRAYEAVFPWAFWASCALFALVHVLNYQENFTALLLMMVIPQFLGGTVLAYARLHYGMWANVSIHALFNAGVASLAAAFGEF
jgi:membrane protease YdiL (CAAX protease family)